MANAEIGKNELICCGVGMVITFAIIAPPFGVPILFFVI